MQSSSQNLGSHTILPLGTHSVKRPRTDCALLKSSERERDTKARAAPQLQIRKQPLLARRESCQSPTEPTGQAPRSVLRSTSFAPQPTAPRDPRSVHSMRATSAGVERTRGKQTISTSFDLSDYTKDNDATVLSPIGRPCGSVTNFPSPVSATSLQQSVLTITRPPTPVSTPSSPVLRSSCIVEQVGAPKASKEESGRDRRADQAVKSKAHQARGAETKHSPTYGADTSEGSRGFENAFHLEAQIYHLRDELRRKEEVIKTLGNYNADYSRKQLELMNDLNEARSRNFELMMTPASTSQSQALSKLQQDLHEQRLQTQTLRNQHAGQLAELTAAHQRDVESRLIDHSRKLAFAEQGLRDAQTRLQSQIQKSEEASNALREELAIAKANETAALRREQDKVDSLTESQDRERSLKERQAQLESLLAEAKKAVHGLLAANSEVEERRREASDGEQAARKELLSQGEELEKLRTELVSARTNEECTRAASQAASDRRLESERRMQAEHDEHLVSQRRHYETLILDLKVYLNRCTSELRDARSALKRAGYETDKSRDLAIAWEDFTEHAEARYDEECKAHANSMRELQRVAEERDRALLQVKGLEARFVKCERGRVDDEAEMSHPARMLTPRDSAPPLSPSSNSFHDSERVQSSDRLGGPQPYTPEASVEPGEIKEFESDRCGHTVDPPPVQSGSNGTSHRQSPPLLTRMDSPPIIVKQEE